MVDRNQVSEAGLPGIWSGTEPTPFSQGKAQVFQFQSLQVLFMLPVLLKRRFKCYSNNSLLRSAPVHDTMFVRLKTENI